MNPFAWVKYLLDSRKRDAARSEERENDKKMQESDNLEKGECENITLDKKKLHRILRFGGVGYGGQALMSCVIKK